ncbi:hypothetical protein GUJ93_ZPchr0010g11207 [Zizania palustris]|uniref:NAC domain-containing protein n=1 Tax=Zizania palustris TaxID=103762 RepID=A0A8J6BPF6_ZIZPA|nr:hypothetical protein GUJ93_ZPchr0010g11207 [Zizania palustris]
MGGDHHHHDHTSRGGSGDDGQGGQADMVMPGFRFHPTEEELIEFYLRRKVEGKRFNIELIAFVDIYRYDPWDLPALASIGDKEWFFYVPRGRKYRNGDRPNRVTPSGYWKATGADRMVRVEGNRSIGLKKTLVFYVGKAPKGLRSSWIMNEYRLPHGDADRYQKEISLCRVYKRPGIDDNFHLMTSRTTKSASGSKAAAAMDKKQQAAAHRTSTSAAAPGRPAPMFDGGHHSSSLMGKAAYDAHAADGTTTNAAMSLQSAAAGTTTTAHALHQPAAAPSMFRSTASVASLSSTTSTEEDSTSLYHLKDATNPMQHHQLLPSSTHALLNTNSSAMATIPIDELSRAIGSSYNYQHANPTHETAMPSSQPSPLLPFASVEKIWDWNPPLESPNN